MKLIATILTAFIFCTAQAQHKTYRTDVFNFTVHNWYYAGIGEDFMSKYGLLPGDTVAILDNVDTIANINLTHAKVRGITFINHYANKKQVPLGYVVFGSDCTDVKFLGNGSKNVEYGFKLFDSTHFGLSWTCTGDLEAAYLDIDGCLIGVQLATLSDVTYPKNYQNFHAHHLRIKHISNEAMYLGYVKDVPIKMSLNVHDIEIDSAGWDGIQTRNTVSTRIYDCRINGVGLKNHYGDQHAILLYNNTDSGVVKNVTVTNCKGIGIFNSGHGDFLFENNNISSDGQSIYNRAIVSQDEYNQGYQNTTVKCNTFRSGAGVTMQFLTDTAEKVTLTAMDNNCDGVFNYTKYVSAYLVNNGPHVASCLSILPMPEPYHPAPKPNERFDVKVRNYIGQLLGEAKNVDPAQFELNVKRGYYILEYRNKRTFYTKKIYKPR